MKFLNRENIESLTVELTHECNSHCLFCYQKKKAKTGVDIKKLKRKIIESRKMGAKYIEFSGGEPTLSLFLPELIQLARDEGFENISLLTNGWRLSYESYFKKLIDSGLKTVIFSVPGHAPDIYGKITRTDKRSFFQFTDALKFAKEAKNIEIGTVIVINKYNYRYLPEIVEWLAKNKPSFITLSYPIPFEGGMDRKMFPNCAEIFPHVKKALDKCGKKTKICVDGVPYCQLPGYEKYILNEIFRKNSLIVDSAGNVSNRLETVNLLSAKTEKCSTCGYGSSCPGIFIDYVSKYNMIGGKKDFGKQKVALDIQSGSCDYDYIFCTRQIGGKRFHELNCKKAVIDYDKLELFFRTSFRVSDHLDIWGREKVDEFEEVFKILGIAKKYFANITLWSSGLKLRNTEKIKRFIENGVTEFEIPIYGASGKTHDSITRRKGSFERVISALEIMDKLKIKVSLHTVLLKQNIEELPQLIKLAAKYREAELSAWFYYPDPAVDHTGVNMYRKYCSSYAEIRNCLSREIEKIGDLRVKFVFFPQCVFLGIRQFMKKAELVETGFVRFMVADSSRMEYKFLTGKGEFGATFPNKCKFCRLKKKCSGVFSDYIKIFGDREMKPINK